MSIMDSTQAIAANIRVKRARCGMGQREVAAAMRSLGHAWFPQTVSRVERGHRNVTAVEVIDLASVLRTLPGALMDMDVYRHPSRHESPADL